MKNKFAKDIPGSARRHPWRTLIGAVGLTLVLVGIVAALNRDEVPSLMVQNPETKSAAAGRNRHYVTTNASGQTIVIDRQTGQTRPLTTDEARTLAEGIKQLVNQSTDGLVQVQQGGGMVSMDLQGRFQNVLLAKKESDGTVSQSCVDNLQAAADFFDIDPVLLGLSANGAKGQPNTAKWADR